MDGKGRKAMLVRLYPNPRTAKALESALEGSRLLYNMLLEECISIHEKGGPFPGKYGMYPLTTELRKNISDDLLAHMYSQVQLDVGNRMDFAFKRFFDRCRNGGVPGFPRFKGKGRFRSFTYTQSGFSVAGDRLKLSKIGEIRFRGGYEFKGKIKTCTVTRKSTGKWFASVVYEPEAVGEGNILIEEKKTSVGIDLGVSRFATLSDGTVFANPKFYERDMERIAVASRRMAKYEKGSKERLKYGRHLAHAYEHIVNRRKAFLDGVSRYLADHYDLIAMEDLNIKEMMESSAAHSLPRAIGSAAWNMLTTMTIRKAENAGGKVVLVDPHYTSQCCSECGRTVPKDLSVRRHVCPGCGLDIDRDFNASLNILGLAVQTGPMCEYRC